MLSEVDLIQKPTRCHLEKLAKIVYIYIILLHLVFHYWRPKSKPSIDRATRAPIQKKKLVLEKRKKDRKAKLCTRRGRNNEFYSCDPGRTDKNGR